MKITPLLIVIVLIAMVIAAGVLLGGWFHHDSGLQGSGTVEARNIRVGSEVGGRIDKVLVREGEIVTAGQVLMTFDDKELLASLAQSRANAEKAKRGFRREDIQEVRAAALQPKRITRCAKTAIARKISPRRKPTSIAPPRTRPAAVLISALRRARQERSCF